MGWFVCVCECVYVFVCVIVCVGGSLCSPVVLFIMICCASFVFLVENPPTSKANELTFQRTSCSMFRQLTVAPLTYCEVAETKQLKQLACPLPSDILHI